MEGRVTISTPPKPTKGMQVFILGFLFVFDRPS